MTLCPLNVSIWENTVIFHKNVLFILTCDEFITVTLKWNNKYFLSLLSLLDWIQTVLPIESSRKVVFPLLSPDLCPCYSPCPKYPLFPPSSIASSRSESGLTSSRKPALMPLVSSVLPPLLCCPISGLLSGLLWCISLTRLRASPPSLYTPLLVHSLALSRCLVNFAAKLKACGRWIDITGEFRIPP